MRSTTLIHPFGKLIPMAVVSICKPVVRDDFSTLVLRGLSDMGSPSDSEGELLLDLGVSVWISRSGECLEDAVGVMLAMRTALIKASGLDSTAEPVPFWGADPRLDVLNLATYLRGLIGRAAREAQCGPDAIVGRALQLLGERRTSSTRFSALG
jgi:hypothetical protein